MIQIIEEEQAYIGPCIKVIGVGGAGGNAVNNMVRAGLTGVEFIAMNTDKQDLARSLATHRFQLGQQLTKGLGAGSDPEKGSEAAREDRDRISELIVGADMVFVAAGMGGGTGTGAAPVICEIAKEHGVLTVAVVTRPFSFEGPKRLRQAEEGIQKLGAVVDTYITVPNQRLIAMANESMTVEEGYALVDDVLLQAVKGVADLLEAQGRVNVDFADIRNTMNNKGMALMGVGTASGEHKVVQAAERAIKSPLLDGVSLGGANSILVNISGAQSLTISEMYEAAEMIREVATNASDIAWGWVVDDTMEDEVKVTVIATGFDENNLIAKPTVERHIADIAVGAGERARVPRVQMASGMARQRDYGIPSFFGEAD